MTLSKKQVDELVRKIEVRDVILNCPECRYASVHSRGIYIGNVLKLITDSYDEELNDFNQYSFALNSIFYDWSSCDTVLSDRDWVDSSLTLSLQELIKRSGYIEVVFKSDREIGNEIVSAGQSVKVLQNSHVRLLCDKLYSLLIDHA